MVTIKRYPEVKPGTDKVKKLLPMLKNTVNVIKVLEGKTR
jgi:hypothetical protein